MSEPASTDPGESQRTLSIGAIARDVVILWVLTFAGGFVVGVATVGGHDPVHRALAIAISNTILSIIGFTIVGSLATQARWKQLFIVAIILWITSLANLAFGIPLRSWIVGLPFTLILMAVGGGISYLFRK